ncbi:Blue-light-activated protein [Planctomycetes bacterium MalM25]|nr:Blue-light-activated protein [Planctomycetes bacterium MalM25]
MTQQAPARRKRRFFADMSVSGKIGLGFAIVLILHLSVVALGHYGVQKADRDRLSQSALLDQVGAFYEIDGLVGELQRNVQLFASTGYQGPRERVERLHQQLSDRLETAILKIRDGNVSGIDSGQLRSMQKSLEAQEKIFRAVAIDRAKRRKLIDKEFVRSAADFDEAITALSQTDARNLEDVYTAEAAFRTAQISALRFVQNPDSALVRTVKGLVSETRDCLRRFALQAGLEVAPAIESAEAFEDAFIQMVQATRGYLHLVNVVLTGESVEFLHLAKEARNKCTLGADRITSQMRRDNLRFARMNTCFSVLTIALGLLAAWMIGRSVAPPLNAITSTIDGLARGEPCGTIPGVNRRDELGKLAHAAEVFRGKAAETERLLVEVTRMKDLERQLSQAKKLESIGQLATGVAHEINTPLQSIASNLNFLDRCGDVINELLGDEELEGDKAIDGLCDRAKTIFSDYRNVRSLRQATDAIHESEVCSERIIEIVRAMRLMSHPENRETSEIDLADVVQRVITVSCNHWKYVAAVALEVPEGPVPYVGVASEISQIVINTVVNAADAIEEHRGADGRLGRIAVRLLTEGDAIFLEVEDDGPGIPEAILDRVFDPFFTTKDVGKGSGQGLAIIHNIVVKQMGGEIEILPVTPNGTLVRVMLPNAKTERPSHSLAAMG